MENVKHFEKLHSTWQKFSYFIANFCFIVNFRALLLIMWVGLIYYFPLVSLCVFFCEGFEMHESELAPLIDANVVKNPNADIKEDDKENS